MNDRCRRLAPITEFGLWAAPAHLSRQDNVAVLPSAHPRMALSRDFGVGRHDLNPQNNPLFLRFKSDARLELTQKPSSVDGHYLNSKV